LKRLIFLLAFLLPSVALAQPSQGNSTKLWDGTRTAAVTAASALKTDSSATTQPVSASSLPLPSGASTAAKQPTLGTAGSASTDVLTIQGIASMTALKTDGSAVTQPVSGTVSVSGNVDVTPTSPAANDYLPMRLTDGTSFYTASGGGGSSATEYTEDAASASDPVGGMLIARRRDTLSGSEVSADGDNIALNATSKGQLQVKLADTVAVDGSGVTQPVSVSSLPLPSGAATAANQTTGNTSLSSIDGKITACNTGAVVVSSSGLPSGAATSAKQDTQTTSLQLIDDIVHADGDALGKAAAIAGQLDDTGTTAATEDKVSPARITAQRGLHVNLRNNSGSEIGTSSTPVQVSLANTAANSTAVKVDGSAVTQPVSAASLPLPSGAATSTKQPALGTAGSASSDVLTVQGVASMTALKVDGSAVTQPVSGTVTANAGTGTFGTNVSQLAGTTTDTNSGNKSAGTLRVVLATDQPALTNKLLVTPDANSAVNLAQAAGNTLLTGNGATGTGSPRVTIASDNTAFSVNSTKTASTVPSGTTMQNGATANGNGSSLNVSGYATAILNVTASVAMSGGTTINFEGSVDDTTWVSILAQSVGTSSFATSTTVTGDFRLNVAGYKSVRARISAYSAGTITVKGYSIAEAGPDNSLNANLMLAGTAVSTAASGIPKVGLTDGSGNAVTSTSSALDVNLKSSGATQTVSGTVTANAGTGTFTVDSELPAAAALADGTSNPTVPLAGAAHEIFNGSTWDRARSVVNGQDTTGTGIQAAGILGQLDDTSTGAVTENQFAPVRISSRRAILVEGVASGTALPASQSGTWTVQPGNTANSTPWLVTPTPGTTGGWSVSSQTALTNTKTSVKASAGTLGGYMFYNPNSSVEYIQVWDVASGSVTVGTTAPTYVIPIPATSGANVEFTNGINHGTAIVIAATTTATGSTAPGTALVGFFLYK
jgi:hypothetical protein